MKHQLIEEMQQAQNIVALTGAGMSTESGLPDFRSQDGLWRQHRPEQLASVEALYERPLLFYEFYRHRLEMLQGVAPNPGHTVLARLEHEGRLSCVVTQNVDGLHGEAGSRDVAEIHGTLRQARCHDCARVYPAELLLTPIHNEDQLPRCSCRGLIRPGVVLFGEMLPEEPFQRAVQAVEQCDGLLVIGSSLQVHPAAGLPHIALERGARLWIINLTATPFDGSAHVVVRAKAGDVLSLWDAKI